MICQGNTCGGERNEGAGAGAEAFSLSAGLTPERRTGKNEDGGIWDADFRANLTKSQPVLWGAPSTGCQQGEPHTGQESPACPSAHHWLRMAWGEHDVSTKAVDGPKDPRGAVQICPLLKLTALIACHNPRINTSVKTLRSNTKPKIQPPSHLFKFSKLLGYFSTIVHHA